MRWWWIGALAGGCGQDARPDCEQMPLIRELEVDLSTGVPVFSWLPADVEMEEIEVQCDGEYQGWYWWAICSGEHARPRGEPLGTTCLTSPVEYGVDQDGVYTEDPDYYTRPRPLPSGARCEAAVSERCVWPGNTGDIRDWSVKFTAP